ncbi:EexN family lipoprotein [Xanthomonas hortorum pv. hederae]|uniref:EexN family lipoprotein n=1 Tax=Xanthomonas hortorum TaxID=56454 RepID=UPI0032E85EDE
MKKLIYTFPLVFLLAGCNNSEPTRTVADYKADTKQRNAMLAACKNNPGEKSLTPNCINADQAETEILNARRGFTPLKPVKF